MNIKTITTVDGVNVVDFGSAASRFYWIENLGSTTVYVSGNENIVPDGDNVKVLSAGCGTMVENLGGKVYILGAGKFQITNQGDKFPPFRNAPANVGGGVMASGNPVQMDGLQGGVPFSEMVVSGKNLLKYPYYTTTKTINGVTFTDNGDGTITANGTATAISSFALIWKNFYLPKGTYTISGSPEGGNVNTGFYVVCGTDTVRFATDTGNGGTFTIADYTNDFTFNLRVNSGVTVDNIVFRPQLEIGSAATAYEPPITGRELTVGVSGKNLLKYPYVQTTRTSYGVTFTDNGDGSITASGTHDGGANLSFFGFSPWWADPNDGRLFLPKGNTVTFRVMGLPNMYQCQLVVKKDKISTDTITVVYGIGESAANYTAEQDCYIACGIYGLNSSVGQAVNFTAYPQLELGDTATEYEPYHGSTTIITPTSNPYTIPNDIRQQDGLNVVSVSEGKISVTGVRKNAAVKKIWDKIDELTTAIIVSNGETIE